MSGILETIIIFIVAVMSSFVPMSIDIPFTVVEA